MKRAKTEYQRTYLIRNVDNNAIKIGKAADVYERLSSLQTGSSSPLVLLLAFEDDRETELHEQFAHARLRSDGEWFDGDDVELNRFVVRNLHLTTKLTERRQETYVLGIYRNRRLQLLKVGTTDYGQVQTELRKARQNSVDKIELLFQIEGDQKRKFFRHFAKDRIKETSFFKPTKRILKFIDVLERMKDLVCKVDVEYANLNG